MVKNYIHNPYVECQWKKSLMHSAHRNVTAASLMCIIFHWVTMKMQSKWFYYIKCCSTFRCWRVILNWKMSEAEGAHIRNEHCDVLFSNLQRKISSAIINFHFLFIVVRNFSAYSLVNSNLTMIPVFKAWIMTKGVINCRNYFTLKMMEYLLWPEDF